LSLKRYEEAHKGLYSSYITMKGGTHPMSYTHRGLSDVVTTVLIILLVVVAVVAIGAYVRTTVEQSGRTVEREGTCLSNVVSVSSCRYLNNAYGGTNLTLNINRATDDVAIASISSLQAVIKGTNGNVQTAVVRGTPPGMNGAIVTVSANSSVTVMNVNASEVTLLTEFTLKNGNKVTCSSTSVPCSV